MMLKLRPKIELFRHQTHREFAEWPDFYQDTDQLTQDE